MMAYLALAAHASAATTVPGGSGSDGIDPLAVIVVTTLSVALVVAFMAYRVDREPYTDWPSPEATMARNKAVGEATRAQLARLQRQIDDRRRMKKNAGRHGDGRLPSAAQFGQPPAAAVDRAPCSDCAGTGIVTSASNLQLDRIAARGAGDQDRLTPGRLRDILTGHVVPDLAEVARLKVAITGLPPSQVLALAQEIGVPLTSLEDRLRELGLDLQTSP